MLGLTLNQPLGFWTETTQAPIKNMGYINYEGCSLKMQERSLSSANDLFSLEL